VRALAQSLSFEDDPDRVMEDAARRVDSGTLQDMPLPEARKFAYSAGIGTQYSIADAVDPEYATLAVAFARQLVEEYDCTKPGEIALAEVAAADHASFLEYSKLSQFRKNDGVVLRERDRAHRRFLTSLGALQRMKRPTLEVKVVADTAFVAQNQLNHASTNHDA
ncbi:MAG: hypothetical protein KGI71_03300, partial [Patescibacteria group bacterium]|nr:hypothetical protein [Patescibacteria group bacterium]